MPRYILQRSLITEKTRNEHIAALKFLVCVLQQTPCQEKCRLLSNYSALPSKCHRKKFNVAVSQVATNNITVNIPKP